MRAQNLPAATGWQWITGGFAIYRKNPPMLSMLVIAYWFAVVFLNLLPVLGTLAASMLIPGLSVGLMLAARHIERDEPVGIQTLLEGFRNHPRTLLALGALYLLCTLGVLGLSTLADGGTLFSFMTATSEAERAALEGESFLLPALVVATLMTPVIMAWWFAPVLVAWHHQPAGKALFFSFVACAMNWRPFLVYGLGLLAVAVILPGMALGTLAVLIPPLQGFIAIIVPVFMALVIAPTVFASFYLGYRDIFGISEIV